MTSFTFRPAKPEDIDSIYSIFSITDRQHRESHPEIFQSQPSHQTAKEYYLESIKATDRTLFVAEETGKIVGTVLCSILSTPDTPILVPRNYGCIENITVHPSYRGKGIGKELMCQVQKWAFERGTNMMELTVWEFNQDAHNFYKQLGYYTTRRRMVKDLE